MSLKLKQIPVLRLTTPKGKMVNLGIPDSSITAEQIQKCLEGFDSGDYKQISSLNVTTPSGQKVNVVLTEGIKVAQILEMTSQIDQALEKGEKKLSVEKSGFWVSNLKNSKGRFHTKEGCMGRATEVITQAQIQKDGRKLCDRCKHRDA